MSELDTQSSACNIKDEARHLDESMHNPSKAAGDKSHGDRTDGENDNEGNRRQNAVDSPDMHRLLDVEADKIVEISSSKPIAISIAIAEPVSISVAVSWESWELLGHRQGGCMMFVSRKAPSI